MRRGIAILILLPLAAYGQPAPEEIGSWRLNCVTDRMTDRTECILRHQDWVERPSVGAGIGLEIQDRGGKLVPVVTARDLSFDSPSRAVLAFTGTAQLRFDRNNMLELPCGLEGRSLVCAPRRGDADRASQELSAAARALVRMSGLGSNTTATTEPTELRLAGTPAAMERYRRAVPLGTAPPPPEPGLDLQGVLGRLRQLVP
ncbi:hypothetical protein [Roseococcus sp. YIM B11640]|uniref:hypothetical protein n=1 Tax=Roseococcus sp. YIM B11640 TaxID=3133973 RepID=UPI003C7BF365